MSDDVLVWSPTAFESAHQRFTTAPETLTAADIRMLNIFDPGLAQRAMRAQSKALQPTAAPAARLDVEAIASELIAIIGTAIAPLAARIAALEQRPIVKYLGVHRDDATYQEGSLVTRQGGLWCAVRETRDAPGNKGGGWVLVVKRGEAK